MPRPLLIALLALFALASMALSLLHGSADLPAERVLRALAGGGEAVERDIVLRLRLPRAAAAFACGALLAQAGALLQVLLRNPLADPYVLGISGGAAVGSLLSMLLGLGAVGTGAGALAGALAVVALVFALSFRAGDWNVYRLLLTGVVISAGCGALVSLLLTLAPAAGVKGMLFWLMGDLAYAGSPLAAWGVLAALALLGLGFASSLNVLSLGPLKARTLGVAVLPLQAGIYFAASLGTASAVLLGGTIGFVGLLAPHALRLLGITDYRWLLPSAVLLGGGFLTLADTAARTIWAPLQLPVGVLTALLGVPLLLLLLPRGR
ncbi:MAG TPA: iron ABC transporter permease [Burkholderiales bacterium]|nr:iron ABC transporter permease [Burkholderiales bacterium]